MADEIKKATKKTVSKKVAVKKAPSKKKAVAKKKAVTKKKAVAKKVIAKPAVEAKAGQGAASNKTPVMVPSSDDAGTVTSEAGGKSSERKKALADKILSATGSKPVSPGDEKVQMKSEDNTKKTSDETGDKPGAKADPASNSQTVEGLERPIMDMSCMEDFRKTFEASAKRWEIVVYPSLLAFIFLAAIGFYMVYMLTGSVNRIANNIEGVGDNMTTITTHMADMSTEIKTMTVEVKALNNRMKVITDEMHKISADVSYQVGAMDSIVVNMTGINQSTADMAVTMHQMQRDTAIMGYNIHSASGPMRLMNNFMPW